LPGIVLLKNKAPAGAAKPLLPLDKSSLKKLCVLGPLAHSAEHMMGNYYGNFDAKLAATPLQGIQEELGECCCNCLRLSCRVSAYTVC
jgi:beta-glucosidase-like glycosyl hydrolase